MRARKSGCLGAGGEGSLGVVDSGEAERSEEEEAERSVDSGEGGRSGEEEAERSVDSDEGEGGGASSVGVMLLLVVVSSVDGWFSCVLIADLISSF